MKPLICLFLLSTAAFANACLSTASGNWNDSSRWTTCGGGVPGNGDTAKIGQGNTITIPAGYHAIVGVSGADGAQQYTSGVVAALGGNGGNSNGGDGTGILVVNGWLTFRGNVEQCNAVWTVGPDAILEHDSSASASPSTTHYRWIIGTYYNPDSARLTIRGTLGHRAIIRNAASSGTFYGFTYNDAWGGQGSGQFDFEYVTISGCGGATNCTDGKAHTSGIASLLRCDHCLVTSSGTLKVATTGGSSSGPLNVAKITNSTVTGTTSGGVSIRADFVGTATCLLDTVFTDGQIVLAGNNGDNATGTHIRNIVMQGLVQRDTLYLGGAQFRVAEFDRVLRITDQNSGASSSAYTDIPGGNATRLMCLMTSTNSTGGNPLCFLGPLGIAGADDSIDGAYLEKLGIATDGDFILGANGPATFTTIKNVVFPCSTTDGYSGSLSSQVTSSTKKFKLYNNTYCGKDDGANSRGFGYESAGNPQTDFLDAARNNIVFCSTNVACYLVHKGPTGTDVPGTYQGVDYNWKWNVSSGPYLNVGTAYSPNPPGQHDSTGDPQFVQQRHFLDWGQMLKPAITTWSDIVAEFAKMNDDTGFDTRFTIENAYNWLRDGYAPRNTAIMTAGDTGGRVGALDVVLPSGNNALMFSIP